MALDSWCIVEIAAILLSGKRGKLCLLTFYMDETADKRQQRLFAVCGIIAEADVWKSIEKQWISRLQRDGIRFFHAVEREWMTGEFQKLADRVGLTTARVIADAIERDLKNILKSHHIGLFCLGCPIVDLKAVREEPKPWIVFDKDPYVMVHKELIYRVAEMMSSHKPPDPVAFIFDENQKGAAFNDIEWAEFKQNVFPPEVADCMVTLAPMDDKKCPPLQAADMIAYAAKKAFEKQLLMPEITYGALHDLDEWRDKLAYVALLSEEYLREVAHACWDRAVHGEWEGSLMYLLDDDGKSE